MTTFQVQLVLGSGGARGLAHVGIIEAIEAAGGKVTEVAGCSMGAVVGGVYCAGHLPALKTWFESLTATDVLRLYDLTWSRKGFVKGERVLKEIEKITGPQLIEQLKVPFVAVATDMIGESEIHYRSGNLFAALRASMAIPAVFTPVAQPNTLQVDGGVLNPLPLNLIHRQPETLVVAVNLSGRPDPASQAAVAEQEDSLLHDFLNLFPSEWFSDLKKAEEAMHNLSLVDLLMRSYDLTQDRLTQLMIQLHPPDILINIPRNACGTFEFWRAREVAARGREAFETAWAQYRHPDMP